MLTPAGGPAAGGWPARMLGSGPEGVTMNFTSIGTTMSLGLLLAAAPSYAQLIAAKDAPVAYGHHHINATNVAADTKFFADALGGTTMTKAGRTIVKVHNALILIREQKPTGGTKGTSVD